ncbi:hypothetical protein PR048_006795 [Dryococelus australis]|uniref:Uncharacterized protein n=1 Tax=Dryococelus australis TaxID=614101 RepID=A0ABQ9IBY5_9NEOP|nr:hypothetical protein PR048_006795 [Dryococelus australis]
MPQFFILAPEYPMLRRVRVKEIIHNQDIRSELTCFGAGTSSRGIFPRKTGGTIYAKLFNQCTRRLKTGSEEESGSTKYVRYGSEKFAAVRQGALVFGMLRHHSSAAARKQRVSRCTEAGEEGWLYATPGTIATSSLSETFSFFFPGHSGVLGLHCMVHMYAYQPPNRRSGKLEQPSRTLHRFPHEPRRKAEPTPKFLLAERADVFHTFLYFRGNLKGSTLETTSSCGCTSAATVDELVSTSNAALTSGDLIKRLVNGDTSHHSSLEHCKLKNFTNNTGNCVVCDNERLSGLVPHHRLHSLHQCPIPTVPFLDHSQDDDCDGDDIDRDPDFVPENMSTSCLYRDICNTEFNLELHQPGVDICNDCDRYNLPMKEATSKQDFAKVKERQKCGKGGSEMASGTLKWAMQELPNSDIEEMTVWSDNCTGQNSNVMMIADFLWLLHTFKSLKDWQQMVGNCGVKANVEVLSMEDHDNMNFHNLFVGPPAPFISRNKGTDGQQVLISTMTHQEKFQEVDLRRQLPRSLEMPHIVQPVRDSLKEICSLKYKDLMKQIQCIRQQFHYYYTNLSQFSSVGDFPDITETA